MTVVAHALPSLRISITVVEDRRRKPLSKVVCWLGNNPVLAGELGGVWNEKQVRVELRKHSHRFRQLSGYAQAKEYGLVA